MDEDKLKDVYCYVDDRGNNPVKEFIKSLPLKERAKILAYISELEKQGNNLRRPLADYLEDSIYELRPKDNRIFYFFYLRDSAVLLHAIKKKTREIPRDDLNLCLKRKNLVEVGSGHVEKLELRGDLNEES